MAPAEGFEPPNHLRRQINSLVRLPIPPHRNISQGLASVPRLERGTFWLTAKRSTN